MPTDTSRTLEIEGSPSKLLGLVGIGVVMTAVSLAIALMPDQLAPEALFGRDEVLIGGWFGTLFFGLCTVVAVRRLLAARGTVITISPDGIRDTRVAEAFIPWNAITGISTWTCGTQKIMVLAVKPDVEGRVGLTGVARWTRSVNRLLGADGLCVSATGVKIDYDTLLQTARDYASARRR